MQKISLPGKVGDAKDWTVLKTKLAKLVTFIAAAHVMGGHWLVLQLIAWSGMMVSYTQQDGFAQGIEKTFDGTAPCPLCHMVEEGREKEKDQPLVDLIQKQDAVLAKPAVLPRRPSAPFAFVLWRQVQTSSLTTAPVPPPPEAV